MQPIIHTLYCDDIRHEVGGKTTFVGSYKSRLLVENIPAVLPKFCIAVWIMIPAQHLPTKTSCRILLDDRVLAEADYGVVTTKGNEDMSSSESLAALTPMFVLAPFKITAEGVIRVRVTLDEVEHKGPGLQILRAKPGPSLTSSD